MKQGISTKLLAAILVAVIPPLVTSRVLLTMAVDHSFQVGINRRVHEGLELAPTAYRALFDALKADFEHSTDGIVASREVDTLVNRNDWEGVQALFAQLVEQRADLVELRLEDAEGRELALAEAEIGFDAHIHRPWNETRELSWDDGGGELTASWVAPISHFDSFQQAGEILETYETLEQGRDHVRSRYVMVYVAMILSVVLLAVALGFFMSRRVTSRVTRLCEATRQVTAGNLSTRVPVGSRDEVGELSSAFNTMVERLLESRERIEYLQRVAAWQQLARRLAHEIKNPLTPIQLAVQEVGDRYRGDDEEFRRVLKQATEIVSEEVEALRRLTSEFSAFAKLPAVNVQQVDLRDFLQDASQALSLFASERGRVVIDLPPAGITTSVDKMLMRRVLDNLVRNAVEAIDENEMHGQVVVRGGRSAQGQPYIAVEDDGPGISDDEKSRVFEPYYTTKDTGTGLGLAIVKKIVLEHGGLVTLETPARAVRKSSVPGLIQGVRGSIEKRTAAERDGASKGRGTKFVIRLQP